MSPIGAGLVAQRVEGGEPGVRLVGRADVDGRTLLRLTTPLGRVGALIRGGVHLGQQLLENLVEAPLGVGRL